MYKENIKLIALELSKLNKEKLQRVLRAGSMSMFQFGDYVDEDFHNYSKGEIISTKKITVPRWQLHIDCPFRLVCGKDIILSKGDMFEPSYIKKNEPDFNWDKFDWDIRGANRYDQIAENYFGDDPFGFTVKKITVSKFGDLKIQFENDFILEIFVEISGNEECWRFFEINSDNHIIITGKGLQINDDKQK